MARKFTKGYFVRGQFVAEGSELDEQLKRELHGEGPSKTDLKAQSAELQELGQQLLGLRADLREPLDLPTRLLDALAELARIKDFEGRRRQAQYVGKLMRQLDEAQIAAIRTAIDAQRQGPAAEALRLHTSETWRERLIADDAALTDWAQQFPASDLQQLRALVRQARKDAPTPQDDATARAHGQAARHGRAWRELFQLIQAALARAEAAGPGLDDEPPYADDTRAG